MSSRLFRRGVGALVGAVFVASVAVVPTSLHPAAAEVHEPGYCGVDAGLAPGAEGDSVWCLQYALTLYGFLRSPLTGVYDQPTVDAVAAFQTANPPLAANGVASKPTLEAMGAYSGVDTTPLVTCLADAPLALGSRGNSVQCLQSVLFDKGFLAFPPNSVYDAATKDAVTLVQAALGGVAVDGIAGQTTLAGLGIWSGVTSANAVVDIGGAGPWPSPRLDLPQFNLTPEGIPYFGNHRICSRDNANIIATEFARDGADETTQQWAVYVASREGGCDHTAVNYNLVTRDDSHCTFQLNAMAGLFNPTAALGRRGWNVDNVKASLKNCADAASDLWVFCGRGPWTYPTYGCQPPWANDLGAEGDA